MNKHFITFLILIISFVSCKKNHKVIDRDDDGNIESIHYYNKDKKIDSSYLYYPSQKLKQVVYFNAGDSLSYTVIYKEDGTKRAEGNIVRNNLDYRIGNWQQYGGEKTDSIVEYINMNNKSYINQVWVLNKKTKDTIRNKGNYYYIFNKDTISVNDTLEYRFYLFQPYFSYDSDMLVVMPENDNDLKEDFSNIDDIKKNTFYSLKNDGIPHPEIPKEVPKNHNANFGIIYKKPGEERIRGYISEYVKDKKDTTKRMERILFFDETIYVKDSVN
ncbi:MAG: hypothetical protein CVU03_02395 [Bacteroidetes bacterium HGW-Bacteroidetes-2]|jgi:hypothetical protein|nr:MAG: hypothetical protein CVU13_05920 [Bacteroidetes bacterium HGW-Bacteroidetes-8]PKP26745.1 MAG: hypothetical protein CVU03_02395 [Bacteroidetes bacterium HGW-Bacteroidetes-2]